MTTEKMLQEDLRQHSLTDEDSDYIEEMAGFYGITLDEAFKRFVSGNIDGITIDDELETEI